MSERRVDSPTRAGGHARWLAPSLSPPRIPPASQAGGLAAAVESGDQRRTLEALRRMLAERIEEGVRARDLAALSYRLMKVMEELDTLPPLTRRRRTARS